jgi:Tol biopolymer transport system component
MVVHRRIGIAQVAVTLAAGTLLASGVAAAGSTPQSPGAARSIVKAAPANGVSWGGAISANGRFVAFTSLASNLVAGDTNRCRDEGTGRHYNCEDVFVRDRATGRTTPVSVSRSGAQGNAASGQHGLAISGDGRLVAFDSYASNLVSGDTTQCHELRDPGQGDSGCPDVFVRDGKAGTTEQVDLSSAGEPAESESYTLLDAMSADGRFVVFESDAGNLASGSYHCEWRYSERTCSDVFVRDRAAGTTERISVRLACEPHPYAPDVCYDGDPTAESAADSGGGAISPDGRFVAFYSASSRLVPGDTNRVADVFVRDRLKKTTERVSVGRRDEQANGQSVAAAISASGRFVVFASQASNLVSGDTNKADDVFVRDRVKGTTERISVSTGGRQADGGSYWPRISANGRFVAFASPASSLVPGDTNKANDVFVRDRVARKTVRVNVSSAGAPTERNRHSYLAAMSPDGRFVLFQSAAANLVPPDTNRNYDVFLHDLATKKTTLISVGRR